MATFSQITKESSSCQSTYIFNCVVSMRWSDFFHSTFVNAFFVTVILLCYFIWASFCYECNTLFPNFDTRFLFCFKPSQMQQTMKKKHFFVISLGPLAGALTSVYGCKKVSVTGSILTAFGFILSIFATDVYYLYFSFGILGGELDLQVCLLFFAFLALFFWLLSPFLSLSNLLYLSLSPYRSLFLVTVAQFLIQSFLF